MIDVLLLKEIVKGVVEEFEEITFWRMDMKRHVMSAAILSLATAAVCQGQIVNGGFEIDPPGAPGSSVTGWTTFNAAFTSGEFARTGNNSLKTFGPFFPGGGAVGLQDIPFSVGQPLTIRGFGLTPLGDRVTGSNFGLLKLEFFNASNASIGAVEDRIDITDTPETWLPLLVQATVPTGTTRATVIVGHIQLASTGGAVYFDDLEIFTGSGNTWSVNGSGDYFVASNWSGGTVPNAVGATAEFAGVISAARTVYADAPVTLGTLTFNNANRYNLTGNGTLTMDVASGQAAINVQSGSHKINLPMRLNDTTLANVAAGTTLEIADPLTLAAGTELQIAGGGTVQILSTVTTLGPATVAARSGALDARLNLGPVNVVVGEVASPGAGSASFGASQTLSSLTVRAGTAVLEDGAAVRTIKTNTLSITDGGRLDLKDNGLIVDYTGTSPLANVAALIASARAGGNWSGAGITSSTAAANSALGIGFAEASAIGSPTSFLGAGVDATSVLVRLTLRGDSNLDGAVNFADLLALARSYGQSGSWVAGDSDYDGVVQFSDLLALARNYNGSLAALGAQAEGAGLGESFMSDFALAVSMVPEPGTLMGLSLLTPLVLRRKR